MIITVIGGGNGAFAAVAALTTAAQKAATPNFELRWWRRGGDAGLAEITLHDHEGSKKIAARATADLGSALAGANLILVPLPATAQADVARALAPHLQPGQVVIAMPGNLGAWTMRAAARACRPDISDEVIFAETGSLPWITRKNAPDQVIITSRGTLTTLSALPASGGAKAAALMTVALPELRIDLRASLLDVALTNGNASLHTPLVLMNAGVIAQGGPFEPHGEGTQAPIRAVQDALDLERVALREALGLPGPHYHLSHFYGPGEWFYDRLGQDLPQVSPVAHEPINFIDHRYVAEDIAIGLSLIVALSDLVGLSNPLTRGFLAQAEAIRSKILRPSPRGPGAEGLPTDLSALIEALLT